MRLPEVITPSHQMHPDSRKIQRASNASFLSPTSRPVAMPQRLKLTTRLARIAEYSRTFIRCHQRLLVLRQELIRAARLLHEHTTAVAVVTWP